MTRYHLINGERVAFTAEEETAADNAEAAFQNSSVSWSQDQEDFFNFYYKFCHNTFFHKR